MTIDEITKDDLIEASMVASFDFVDLLSSVSNFLKNDAYKIRGFYLGDVSKIPAGELRSLSSLLLKIGDGINALNSNKNSFDLYKNWILMEMLEESLLSLETIDNFKIWSRSSRDINVFAGNIEIDYVQKQNQTIEDIQSSTGLNPDDWTSLAIRNNLKEEDYNSEGGKSLKVIFPNLGTSILQSVIGPVTDGFSSYGIDIKKKIEFNDDDLVILGNLETLFQSIDILLSLRKGDNPAFPLLGLDQVSILGANRGSILFPVIFRQITDTFRSDDTLAGIEIKKVEPIKDSINIDLIIYARFKQSTQGLIQI